jgi:serine/threonine protein phosphatase PrpC
MKRLLYFLTFFLCTFLQITPLILTHSSWTEQGNRRAQEDRYFPTDQESPLIQINGAYDAHFFGVYDGHGGDGAAQWAHATLHKHLSKEFCKLLKKKEQLDDADVQQALSLSFITTSANYACCYDGTTATVALFMDSKLYCANVGDTQAVLSRQGIARTLTTKHTVNNYYAALQENPHVQLYEDFATTYPQYTGFPFTIENLNHQHTQRSWSLMMQVHEQMFLLNLCRTLGDKVFSDHITAQPDVSTIQIVPHDEFVIIASDGLWDVIGLQPAVDFINAQLSTRGIAADQVDACIAQDIARDLIRAAHGASAHDNATATIIFFNHQ